jgi:hypothetical protein
MVIGVGAGRWKGWGRWPREPLTLTSPKIDTPVNTVSCYIIMQKIEINHGPLNLSFFPRLKFLLLDSSIFLTRSK